MKTEESIPRLDDIIFEKRNKSYGAYELRTKYHKRLNKSLAISISAMLSLFSLFLLQRKVEPVEFVEHHTDSLYVTDDFNVQQIHPTQTQQRQQLQQQNAIDEHAFVPVSDTNTSPETTDTTSLPLSNNNNSSEGSGTGDENDSIDSTPAPVGGDNDVKGLSSVDKIPEFPGGIEKFYSFLINRIHYTSRAREAGLNGKMYVRFVIDENGYLTDVKLISGLGFGIDEQIQEVLVQSPKWNPGLFKNIAVKTEMVLPLVFNTAK